MGVGDVFADWFARGSRPRDVDSLGTPTLRPKFWANVRAPSRNSVISQPEPSKVLPESPQRPSTGIFGQHSGRSLQYPLKDCST